MFSLGDFYNKLNSIFVEYKTNQWKNGWQNEGDTEDKSLTLIKEVKNHNMFLIDIDSREVTVYAPDLKVNIRDEHDVYIRIDIHKGDEHIYYYLTKKSTDCLAHQEFILDICRDAKDVYGEYDPKFAMKHYRDIQLNKIGI